MQTFYSEFSEMPLVSISTRSGTYSTCECVARSSRPARNLYRPVTTPQWAISLFLAGYLGERCDRAIAIAKAAKMPLKIAAKWTVVGLFQEVVVPLLDDLFGAYRRD